MVSAPEASELLSAPPPSSKSEVSVEHLDYKYISACTDAKYLERIVRVLRSGREGLFPQLTQHAENRLRHLNPASRVLNVPVPIKKREGLDSSERTSIDSELAAFVEEVSLSGEPAASRDSDDDSKPAVRGQNRPISAPNQKATKSDKGSRIKSADYRSWDKFDVDAECEKIDQLPPVDDRKKPRLPSADVPAKLRADDAEVQRRANLEKEKGNEAFRCGDFEEAVIYYTRCIRLDEGCLAAYNNRAMSHLKLSQFAQAVSDTQHVLDIEPDNMKALLRRGQAELGLNNVARAAEFNDRVLAIDCENKAALKLKSQIDKKRGSSSAKPECTPEVPKGAKRLHITECSEDEDEEDGAIVVDKPPNDLYQETPNGGSIQPPSNKSIKVEEMKPEPLRPEQVEAKGDSKASENGHGSEEIWDSSEVPERDLQDSSSTSNGDQFYDCSTPTSLETPLPIGSRNGVVTEPKRQVPERVLHHKARANQLYSQGQYHDAMLEYCNAYDAMSEDDRSHFNQAVGVLWSNKAACHIKMGNLKQAITDATNAYLADPTNAKALLRRASCFQSLERPEQAYVDMQQAVKQNPALLASVQHDFNAIRKQLVEIHGSSWSEKLPPFNSYGAESTTERFNRLKSEGNELVQKNDYTSAVELYSQCISVDSSKPVGYANRALCYNILEDYHSAVSDCTIALNLLKDSPDANLEGKVYYRRCNAKRALQDYRGALDDMVMVRKLFPKVKKYEQDFTDIMDLYKKQKAAPPKKIKIVEVDSLSEDEDENTQAPPKTTKISNGVKPGVPQEEPIRKAQANPGVQPVREPVTSFTRKETIASVPTLVKKTPYEFTQAWQSIKNSPDTSLHAALIEQIGTDLCSVISSKCDGEMFSKLVHVMNQQFRAKPTQCLSMLESLTKIKRFQVCLMFLGDAEKSILGDLITFLSQTDAARAQKLRTVYKL